LVLMSAWPFVNFANVNRDKVFSIPVVLAFYAISCGAAVGLHAVLRRLVPVLPAGSSALAIAAAQALFFGSAVLLPPIESALQGVGVGDSGAAWLAVIACGMALAAWCGSRGAVVAAVATGLAVAVVVPAADLTGYALRRLPAALNGDASQPTSFGGGVISRPNVYLMIADGYGRTDTMRRALGFDNSAFVEELRDLGFFVADRARANYPMTFLALSSVLSLDYGATELTPRYTDRSRFNAKLAGDNEAVRTFKHFGYAFVQVGSGLWQETGCRGHEDICLEKAVFGAGEVFRLGFGETETALMQMTPVFKEYVAVARARGIYDGAITNFAGVTKALRTLVVEKPLFVVAHSYPPHAPFIYHADCSIRDEIIHDYGPLRDGGKDTAGRELYRQLYAESAECVSRQIVFFAREIVRRDPTAIVLIQSDHGSDTTVDWSAAMPLSAWTAAAVEERFGVLNAIRLPQRCHRWQYDRMSPVNTFRLVFACLEGREPDYLPDRSFVAAYENHPDFGAVYEYH
jgi:hypothetical protein